MLYCFHIALQITPPHARMLRAPPGHNIPALRILLQNERQEIWILLPSPSAPIGDDCAASLSQTQVLAMRMVLGMVSSKHLLHIILKSLQCVLTAVRYHSHLRRGPPRTAANSQIQVVLCSYMFQVGKRGPVGQHCLVVNKNEKRFRGRTASVRWFQIERPGVYHIR